MGVEATPSCGSAPTRFLSRPGRQLKIHEIASAFSAEDRSEADRACLGCSASPTFPVPSLSRRSSPFSLSRSGESGCVVRTRRSAVFREFRIGSALPGPSELSPGFFSATRSFSPLFRFLSSNFYCYGPSKNSGYPDALPYSNAMSSKCFLSYDVFSLCRRFFTSFIFSSRSLVRASSSFCLLSSRGSLTKMTITLVDRILRSMT